MNDLEAALGIDKKTKEYLINNRESCQEILSFLNTSLDNIQIKDFLIIRDKVQEIRDKYVINKH